jgi:DNA-binding MarR family transcriptional regulator
MSGIFVHNTWMSIPTDQWADQLHAVFLAMVGYFNRPEPDAMMIVAAGIKLDRALFPLLSRIGLAGKISVVELGHITGKDHSTVSRQVAKLERLGLVKRAPDPKDGRVSHLVPTADGEKLLGQLRTARRAAIRCWFADWSAADRKMLLTLLTRVRGMADRGAREDGWDSIGEEIAAKLKTRNRRGRAPC